MPRFLQSTPFWLLLAISLVLANAIASLATVDGQRSPPRLTTVMVEVAPRRESTGANVPVPGGISAVGRRDRAGRSPSMLCKAGPPRCGARTAKGSAALQSLLN